LSAPQSGRTGTGFGPGLVTGLVVGLIIAAIVAAVTGFFDSDENDPVVDARDVIESNYFREPNVDRLDEASIDGMVEDLRRRYDDRFSHFFTAEQLEDFLESTSGSFSGVGLTVAEVPKGLKVVSTLPDTPAEQAGLEADDVIVAVDGKSIAGVPSDVSTARIKGPPGTEVDLDVIRGGKGKPETVTLERADVRVPAVRGAIRRAPNGDKVAYVRFFTFSEGAHGELRKEVERLYRMGADRLVLDLRDNGGGLLNEAVLSTSVFLEDGNVASTRSRTQGDQDYPAAGDALDPRPMVVLVNRGTASASEILTAALQQNDLAEVVGTRTYGKGTFQEVIDLPAGGALDLTIGEYLTSDGTSILGEGVKPNVRVEDDADTERDDEALDRALEVVESEPAPQP
jgi:carboxyl-terminal processing protease